MKKICKVDKLIYNSKFNFNSANNVMVKIQTIGAKLSSQWLSLYSSTF